MALVNLDEPVSIVVVVKTKDGHLYLKRQEQGRRYPVCATEVWYRGKHLGTIPGAVAHWQQRIRLNGVRWQITARGIRYEEVERGTEVRPDEKSEGCV